MPVWCVYGGNRLEGSLPVQGAKNAVLPILAASLLGGVSRIENCPELSDVDAAVEILQDLGCRVMQKRGEILVDSRQSIETAIPAHLMKKMRSSLIFMGAILARCGEVRLSRPGGCDLGERPIDLHLKAMEALGAEAVEDDGAIVCRASRLEGAEIALDYPSVGATENAMLAACGAVGETVIRNAAREPEIVDLQKFLNRKGARITGAGTSVIHISGFRCREEMSHFVMPDRIAAATFLCAAASAGGDVCVQSVIPEHFEAVTRVLSAMGCAVSAGDAEVRLSCGGRLRAYPAVSTAPYPGFPTDAQPLLMAAALRAEGESLFRETVFENRFRHAEQMRRLGAEIRIDGADAAVRGVPRLRGGTVTAEDLRGGAALVLAGLAAEGQTLIRHPEHIARGYSDLAGDLRRLGAGIRILETE